MDVDFHDRQLIADPFPTFELIRAEGRVVWNNLLRLWMVPGYGDNVELLTDWHRFSNSILHEPSFSSFVPGDSMLNTDPPKASQLRRMQQEPFTRRALANLQPRIAAIVESFLARFIEKLADGEQVDLIADYLREIPTVVICEMMGIAEDLRPFVQRWSDDLILGLRSGDDEAGRARRSQAAETGRQMNDLLLAERVRLRRQPVDDVLSLLSGHHDLEDGDYLAACQLLISAGNETTYKAAANGIVLLSRHPDQRRLLLDDPARLPRAVDEVLRYEGVPQASPRRVMGDTVLGGVDLAGGDEVVALLVAGNRDPARFNDPQRFDVTRHPNPHLAFAHGTHLCLGANLARMEMQAMIGSLLERLPDYEITSVDYGESFHVRGPSYVGLAGVPVAARA
jgi:cytochrome P450